MSERRPPTEDRPTLVGAWANGRYYIGPPDGDGETYLSAETTVEIKHAR